MLVGVSQRRLLVSVPSKRMRSRPLELPWLPSTLLPAPAPRPRFMLKRRIAGCGWRESAGLARPLFLTVLPVRVSDPGVTLLGLERLMPYVPAPSLRRVVGKSWVKLRPPQSPAAGLHPVTSADGHVTGPTLLSRSEVMVAPPAVASRVAPWKVSVLSVFTTAFAGRVRIAPDAIVRPFTTR